MNRYENVGKLNRGLKTIKFPRIQTSPQDVVIISKDSDRLDILAQKFYGNQKLYWIIALANNLGKGSLDIAAGTTLRIPMNVIEISNEYRRLNS